VRTLHITPSPSAGGSLRQAIRDDGRDDEVLPYWDDLSCGPIVPDDLSVRAAWWAEIYDESEIEIARNKAFWDRVAIADEQLVVWFGRHSALELAFFLAWADRLGERSYRIIDVTGLCLEFRLPDGSLRVTPPTSAVGTVPSSGLQKLLGSEREVIAHERAEACRHWRRLKEENAAFRVVSAAGLVSAPVDHFDPLLMAEATKEWRKVARIIGDTMGHNCEPYFQVGDLMLRARIVALIEAGELVADGNPWDVQSCRVRLPA
jgi:hypothetical protein